MLDGPTLAAIYLGDISRWNDPAIKKLNPKLNLPKLDIAPVYRSDGSGTNFLFTNYLSKVSPGFSQKIGANTSVQWPVGIGAKGNEGVANQTTQTSGAIGYVEYAYVKQTSMTYARLLNHDGKYVAPEAKAFQAAAANADWAKADGYYLILTDQPGSDSWPITGASFILMHADSKDANTVAALKFFDWAYKSGQKMAEDLDYVPLPDKVAKLVEKTWHGRAQGERQAGLACPISRARLWFQGDRRDSVGDHDSLSSAAAARSARRVGVSRPDRGLGGAGADHCWPVC